MSDFYVLTHPQARQRAAERARTAPDGWECHYRPARRNSDQNAAQWPILEAFSSQLQWPVNGAMTTLTKEEWKDILTAAFRGEQRVTMGLDGGFVMLGQRTSKFSKREFSEWLEFLHATAVDRGVVVYAEDAA